MQAKVFALGILFSGMVLAQAMLDQAYAALREKHYDVAIGLFRAGLAAAPDKLGARKDFAYTLLKTGDREAARDEFAEVLRRDPADLHVAMEFAFLAYETGQPAQARRVFNRVRKTGNKTAEEAFQNIDKPLAEGMARWRAVVEQMPENFSAHEELARLAEQRDEFPVAATHYMKAWRLKPSQRALLLDMGRLYQALDLKELAAGALLAASRGAEPRTAERARALMPARYPFVYEFERALKLDPDNIDLRREFAYLLLEMQQKPQAEQEFAAIVAAAPNDLLSMAQLGFLRLGRKEIDTAKPLLEKVLAGDDEELADRVRTALKLPQTLRRRPDTTRAAVKVEAKELAARSYEKGYMKDALKYLTIAHENDPLDFEVILKIGWVNNIMKNDREAVRWFNLARRSPDAKIAAEAGAAFKNLASEQQMFRTTFWAMPIFSSRWRDVFAYSQLKTEFRVPGLGLRPYFSARLLGDARGADRSRAFAANPQYLSESSIIAGVGIATAVKHGAFAWVEAGTAMAYRKDAPVRGAVSDYRGGVSITRALGTVLGGERAGRFADTVNDGVFVSRFQNNFLLVSQNRIGRSLSQHVQAFGVANITADVKRQYWANFAEGGTGLRFRWAALPPPVFFNVQVTRGVQLINTGNPRRPNFYDVRIGFWYAITR